jgi:CHAT domain-containing protein
LVDGDEKSRLMAEAALTPDCLDFALSAARAKTASDPPAAGRYASLAIDLAERRSDFPVGSAAWRVRGQALRGEGDHARAAEALETASELAARAGDPLLAAQTLIGRIDSLGWIGRYEDAVALARRLETELRERNSPEDAAKVLVNLGSLHYRKDQYRPALDCYQRAMQTLTETGDRLAVARVQANTANVLMEMNRADEALSMFEQARGAFAEAGMLTATAMVDANIGFLSYISGRHSSAVAALTRARQEFTQRGQMLEAAKCEADMAEAYRELNLHPEALASYESAIRHFEGSSVDYERARAELGRAAVLMAIARPAEALEGLQRAEAVFRAHKNTVRTAHVLLLRASFLASEGRDDEARSEAARAAAIFARHRLHGWAAEARFLLASVRLRSGDDAARLMRAVSRSAQAHSKGWLHARAESALGHYFRTGGHTRRALRHFRNGVEALEQARTLIAPEEMHVAFLRDKVSIYEYTVGTLLARGGPRDIREALEIVERAKSRLLLERVQTALEGRAEGRSVSADVEARLAALRAELSRSYHRLNALDEGEARRLGASGAVEAEALSDLERQYKEALQDADLAGTHSAQRSKPLPDVVGAAELQKCLAADEALVEFYVVEGEVCAFVLTPRTVHMLNRIAPMAEVLFAARRLRFQLQRVSAGGELPGRHAARYAADTQSVLAKLYDLLLRPLEPLLSAKKIVLAPYSGLHGLPFHAFCDGQGCALDRWEFIYSPSAAVWYQGARQESRSSQNRPWNNAQGANSQASQALLVSVPSPGIEKVTEETDRLKALLPKSVALQGEHATLAAFRKHAGCCAFIHMATHALYRSDNPLFSGLQFADGWLLARDLYEMSLDCNLATLSACQTGVAFVEAGDELFGLQRGFLAAGARSVAASLWLADDKATAELMQRFYTGLTAGRSKAAALQAAQQQVRCLYPHPYHWAAFVLIGER